MQAISTLNWMENTEQIVSVKQRGLADPEAEVHRKVSVNVSGHQPSPGLHQDGGQPLPEPPLPRALFIY